MREHRFVRQQAAEVGGELAGGGVAQFRILGHRLADHQLDVAAQLPLVRAQPDGLPFGDPAGRGGERQTGDIDRQALRQQLVADDPERIDVGAHVDRRWIAGELFGGHVGQRAEHLPGVRPERHAWFRRVRRCLIEAADAEVEHFRLPLPIDQHVAGLQVAVDHAAGVGVRDRLGDGGEEREARERPQAAALRVAVERLAVDELHDQVGGAAQRLGTAAAVDRGDAGVGQPRQQPGFPLESARGLGAGQLERQRLQRDAPLRLLLLRFVDHAHAAAPDQAQDPEAVDLGTRGDGRPRDRADEPFGSQGWRASFERRVRLQQPLDALAQRRIGDGQQAAGALVGGDLDEVEERRHLGVQLAHARAPGASGASRSCSQARA